MPHVYVMGLDGSALVRGSSPIRYQAFTQTNDCDSVGIVRWSNKKVIASTQNGGM